MVKSLVTAVAAVSVAGFLPVPALVPVVVGVISMAGSFGTVRGGRRARRSGFAAPPRRAPARRARRWPRSRRRGRGAPAGPAGASPPGAKSRLTLSYPAPPSSTHQHLGMAAQQVLRLGTLGDDQGLQPAVGGRQVDLDPPELGWVEADSSTLRSELLPTATAICAMTACGAAGAACGGVCAAGSSCR